MEAKPEGSWIIVQLNRAVVRVRVLLTLFLDAPGPGAYYLIIFCALGRLSLQVQARHL